MIVFRKIRLVRDYYKKEIIELNESWKFVTVLL